MTRIFWKIKSNESSNSQRIPAIWIKNELYELKESDKEILEGSDCCLNYNLMDAGQKVICHWLLAFSSSRRVQVSDSPRTNDIGFQGMPEIIIPTIIEK